MEPMFLVTVSTAALLGILAATGTVNSKKTNELYRVRMARRAAKRRIAARLAPSNAH